MKLSELTTRDDIGYVLDEMNLRTGVEVGVAFGENAEMILKKSNIPILHLVDSWNYVDLEDPRGYADAIKNWQGCYEYCKDKMKPYINRVVFNVNPSHIAAEMFDDESIDFVYIDANHMSPYIDNDLVHWYDKVKNGGIFGGHDYHVVIREDYECNVKTAVDNFFKDKNVQIHVTQDSDPSWYIIK